MEQVFTGRLEAITNDKTGYTKKNEEWKSVELVLKEDKDQYPQSVVIKCGNKLYDMARKLKIGSMLTVHYNFRSNEYKGNYYNNVEAWRIDGGEVVGSQKPQNSQVEDTGNLPF